MVTYRLLADSEVEPSAKAGDIVYKARKYDYGLAGEDSRLLGFPCVSVTKDAGDDYPFLVVPAHDPSPDVEDT